MHIPFYTLQHLHHSVRAELLEAMEQVLDASSYILGERLLSFEKAFSKAGGVAHTIGVGNGLDALKIALRCLGIGPGDEVIVPAHTFIATWLAVSEIGAVPVPADIDPITFNISTLSAQSQITVKTKAIIAVHLYGRLCALPDLQILAKAHGLFLVEDYAQAHFAELEGQKAGTFGEINATSFYPVKILGALGDAGALTTSNPILAEKARLLRNYGSLKKNEHEVQGYNSRLDELQAALLEVKLRYLSQMVEERIRLAGLYHAALKDIEGLVLPEYLTDKSHVYHLYVVRTNKRDALQKYLKELGIETGIHYPIPIYRQRAYPGFKKYAALLPVTEEISRNCLSLPLYPGMKNEEIAFVSEQIRCFFEETD